jgi:uncharacterized membrane protein
MYDLFQFLHVVFAVVWVGSGVGLVALMAVMTRAADHAALGATARHIEVLGNRLFGPAAGLTLVFGVVTVLVSEGRVGFTEPWIVVGFAGFAVSGLMTMLANPVRQKMAKAATELGPDHADVVAYQARARVLNYIDLLVLFIVMGAMVIKPGATSVI